MLERSFLDVYTRFKLHFYRKIFARFGDQQDSLSAVETFCVESICVLGTPTIQEFSSFVHISPPNATYKVNSLIKKGYVRKVQSQEDKREYYLQVTEKFHNYYAMSVDYHQIVIARIHQRFTPEEVEKFGDMLHIIATELMSEVNVPNPRLLLAEPEQPQPEASRETARLQQEASP